MGPKSLDMVVVAVVVGVEVVVVVVAVLATNRVVGVVVVR